MLTTALLAGCGGEVDLARTPAGAAQVQLLENLYDGQFDQAYAALHPAYQRIVSRARFEHCSHDAALGKLDSIEVLDVYNDPVQVPGAGRQQAKAVRVRLTSSDGATATFVNHEVKLGTRWRWVLTPEAVRVYQSGRCPTA